MKVTRQDIALIIEGALWAKSTPRDYEKLAEHLTNLIYPIISQLKLEIKELSKDKE